MDDILIFLALGATLLAFETLRRRSRPLTPITFDELEGMVDGTRELYVVPRPEYERLRKGTTVQIQDDTTSIMYTCDGFAEILDISIKGRQGMLVTFIRDEVVELQWISESSRHNPPLAAKEYNQAFELLKRARAAVRAAMPTAGH